MRLIQELIDQLSERGVGFARHATAAARLAEFAGADCLATIVSRADGRFVPVVILNERTTHYALSMAIRGILVIN
jgi:hypothetical protein